MRLIQREPQADFPFIDISDHNAMILEEVISDFNVVERAHELSESNVYLYEMAHQALRHLGMAHDYSPVARISFSYGAAVYETIATYVRDDAPRYGYFEYNI